MLYLQCSLIFLVLAFRHQAAHSLEHTSLSVDRPDARAFTCSLDTNDESCEAYSASEIGVGNWGLLRISCRSLTSAKGARQYTCPASSGEHVNVYLLDSGIDGSHPELAGKVVQWTSFLFNDTAPERDDYGHGTHTAAIIAGKTFGVARKVRLFSVKVLDGQGLGKAVDVAAGLRYVAERIRSQQSQSRAILTVVNLSLHTEPSQQVDEAASELISAGGVLLAAAANAADNPCLYSPARQGSTLIVGSSDMDDKRSMFSPGAGSCVRLYAPGDAILSAWPENRMRTMSGTSMATPFVAGVAALLLGDAFAHGRPFNSTAQVYSSLLAHATKGVLQDTLNTSNMLVYNK